MMPGLIEPVVKHTHQFRRASHHGNVSLVVNALKKFADVLNCVDVFHGAIASCGKRLFESLRSTDVSRAGRSGQEKDARLRIHPRQAPIFASRITKLYAARRQFSQALHAPRSAARQTASNNPEIRGSTLSLLPGQVACAGSYRAA